MQLDTTAAIEVLRRSAEETLRLQQELDHIRAKLATFEAKPKTVQAFDPIVNTKQVIKMTGLGKATIYARMTKGIFPRRVTHPADPDRSIGWRQSDVQGWMDELSPVCPK